MKASVKIHRTALDTHTDLFIALSTKETHELAEEVAQLEAAMGVLRAQLEEHKHHPHAPVLTGGNGGGTVKCVCFACNLARKALAALRGGK